MNLSKSDLLLYAVTDRNWTGERTLESQVEEAIECGVTFVQIREKSLEFDKFVLEASKIKNITDRHKVPFVINDNIDVAIAIDADGVHIGQSDCDVLEARNKLGKDKIVGVSAQTVEQAKLAEKAGADYIGVGAMFSTNTKLDAKVVGFDTLKDICANVDIPVIAIGGIDKNNMNVLSGSGICGVAVVSAIFGSENIKLATKSLSEEVIECFQKRRSR